MHIREAQEQDFDKIWPIFKEVVSAGDTYPYQPDTSRLQAREIWWQKPDKTFLIEDVDRVLGTYYIKENQPGLGSHVCNCGYMVCASARGRGAATAMCRHSQSVAIELGYKAMQFNLVVATNQSAKKLWQKLGFEVVGKIPKAFNHRTHGYVDAFIMYKWLATTNSN